MRNKNQLATPARLATRLLISIRSQKKKERSKHIVPEKKNIKYATNKRKPEKGRKKKVTDQLVCSEYFFLQHKQTMFDAEEEQKKDER